MAFENNRFSGRESSEGESSDSGGAKKNLLNITGDNAKIEGKLQISNSIEIDCEVLGELIVDGQILIQENGYVNAEVRTIDAKITGIYEGNMEASGNVQITETGKVNGNIKTDSLIIEKGGVFSGNVARITGDTIDFKAQKEEVEHKQDIDTEFEEKNEEEVEHKQDIDTEFEEKNEEEADDEDDLSLQ